MPDSRSPGPHPKAKAQPSAAPTQRKKNLVPIFELWPDFWQGAELGPSAQIDVKMLVRHRERVVDRADFFDARKFAGKGFVAVAHHDHAFAGIPARSPVIVILVSRKGGGQAHLGTEEINRAGLAIILSEDGAALSLAWRNLEKGIRDNTSHLIP